MFQLGPPTFRDTEDRKRLVVFFYHFASREVLSSSIRDMAERNVATFDNSVCNLTRGECPKFIGILSRQVLIAVRRDNGPSCCVARRAYGLPAISSRCRQTDACITFYTNAFPFLFFAGGEERRVTVGIWTGLRYL